MKFQFRINIIKKIALIIFLSITFISVSAQKYYIANTGNDTNPGTESKPWKSIDKLNNSTFKPGDQILFKRGDVWRGEIKISNSGEFGLPITFGAYGSGDKWPVIKGSKVIASWSKHSDNIWKTSEIISTNSVHSVFINDEFQPIGRYPNTGYLKISSTNDKNTIIDDNLNNPSGYWNNGEVVFKSRRWFIDRIGITTSEGTILNLTDRKANYGIKSGYGYFIQNHVNTLDLNNEWAFDKESKDLFLLKTDGTNPNSQTIEADFYDYGIFLENVNYITIENIHFMQQRLVSIKLEQCSNINLYNSKISFSAGRSLELIHSNRIHIADNEITDTSDDAIYTRVISDVDIKNNTIINTGIIAGNFEGQANAFQMSRFGGISSNVLIQNNLIENVGYIGISFIGENIIIKNNYINHPLLLMDDGGGIYTYKSELGGNEIINNIVLNGKGTDEGTIYHNPSAAVGIYIDDLSKGIKINGNSVAYCGTGVFIHNSKDLEITENTVYHNTQSQLKMSQDQNSGLDDNIRDLNVQNNIFFGAGQGELGLHFKTHQNDIDSFGTFDNNFVYNPYDDIIYRRDYKPNYPSDTKNTFDLFSLNEWQIETGWSINSTTNPDFYTEYIVKNSIEEKNISNANFANDISGWAGAGIIKPILSQETDTNFLGSPCLKIEFESNSGHTVVSHYPGSRFDLIKDKVYEISFSIISDTYGGVQLRIVNSGFNNDYSDICYPKTVQYSPTKKDYKVALVANKDSHPQDARLAFDFRSKGSTVWIDNISLDEVDIVKEDPKINFPFYYNANIEKKEVYFGNVIYQEIDGNRVDERIVLKSYASKILMLDTTVKEYSDNTYLIAYPNPVQDLLTVSNKGVPIESYRLFDSLGQLLRVSNLSNNNQINVSNLSHGLYILEVITNSRKSSIKFIKK